MPNVYVLVGNIASGKSTFCNSGEMEVISKDDLRYCIRPGEYVFDVDCEGLIQMLIKEKLRCSILGGESVIIDETNMSVDSRKWVLDMCKDMGATPVAIVFPDRGEDSHVYARLKDNHGDTSESTWREVYRRKYSQYVMPTKEEGFDDVFLFGANE